MKKLSYFHPFYHIVYTKILSFAKVLLGILPGFLPFDHELPAKKASVYMRNTPSCTSVYLNL